MVNVQQLLKMKKILSKQLLFLRIVRVNGTNKKWNYDNFIL